MDNARLVIELEMLYQKFLTLGNFDKAQEVLFKITELRHTSESTNNVQQNILLG